MQTLYSPSLGPARGIACETKYLISPEMADEIRAWARTNLEPDPNGLGPHADAYDITTLYLDTPDFDVFRRQGSYARGKYRIRRYGESDTFFLERKLKVDGKVRKRRTRLPLPQLDTLHTAAPDPAWSGYWYHRRMQARRLEPVCQLTYNRMARMAHSERGPIRLTMDDNIFATEARNFEFPPFVNPTRVHAERIILELKYVRPLPVAFTELIVEFGLQPTTASKYREACTKLGLGVRQLA